MKPTTTFWLFTLKKYSYLVFLIPFCLPIVGVLLGKYFHAPNLFSYLTVISIFILIPLIDYLLGHDIVNPDPRAEQKLEAEWYYRTLTLLAVPLLCSLVVYGAYYFTSGQLTFWGKIGWTLSIGIISGGIGIVIAHELIHKNNRYERFAGGLLLSLVCYATFKVEHIRGHHIWVATPEDNSTAVYNENLYHFLKRALKHNFYNGWKLEAQKLQAKNLKAFCLQNELIFWYGLSALLMLCLAVIFGAQALLFFLAQSLIAILLLEIINYVEHYGLLRKRLADGKYEPPTDAHSWNSDYLLSNLILFQLQRHADHHVAAKRRYQILIHRKNSPQLPAGYPTMVILALFPPLWFRLINPMLIKNQSIG